MNEEINNQNLSEEEKNDAMSQAKKILKKMNIPLMPEAEKIMNSFLNGEVSKKEAFKEAKKTKRKK